MTEDIYLLRITIEALKQSHMNKVSMMSGFYQVDTSLLGIENLSWGVVSIRNGCGHDFGGILKFLIDVGGLKSNVSGAILWADGPGIYMTED